MSSEDLKQAAAKQEAYLEGLAVSIPESIGEGGVIGRRAGTSQVIDITSGARGETRTPKGFPAGS